MYAGSTYDFGSGPQAYPDAGHGPYTHYVDNTHPSAADTGNPFGSAALPRRSLPKDLPAGSVVEIHGGPYPTAETVLVAQGTAAKPVFVRGIDKPRLGGKLTVQSPGGVESAYTIIEGLDVFKIFILAPTSYLACRDNDIHGDATNGGIGIDSYNSAYSNHHLLIFRNTIHDNGDWQADYDQDVHGICLTRYTNNVWILDNEFYHNSGDGLQINAGSLALQPYTHHIYVGRNRSHENKQSGMWSKQAVDVIFSQNTVYDLKPIGAKPSAFGAGMGFQYAPERVWFLYNHVYNCCFGISSGSTSGLGTGQDSYYIGNLIHDIHHDPNYAYNPATSYSNAAIALVGTVNKYIINNTISNCDAGINSPSAGKAVIANNIISNITEPAGNHVFLEDPTASSASELSYNLFWQDGGAPRFRWNGTAARDLQAIQTQYGKGATCLIGDPLFVNATGGDFRLQVASPAIDHATVSTVYQTFYSLYGLDISVDYAGSTRPQGAAWDIGAYEYAAGH